MIRSAGAGIWSFVVGDDWRTAAGVIAALGGTALVAGAGLQAWWLCPLATVSILYWSVRRP